MNFCLCWSQTYLYSASALLWEIKMMPTTTVNNCRKTIILIGNCPFLPFDLKVRPYGKRHSGDFVTKQLYLHNTSVSGNSFQGHLFIPTKARTLQECTEGLVTLQRNSKDLTTKQPSCMNWGLCFPFGLISFPTFFKLLPTSWTELKL